MLPTQTVISGRLQMNRTIRMLLAVICAGLVNLTAGTLQAAPAGKGDKKETAKAINLNSSRSNVNRTGGTSGTAAKINLNSSKSNIYRSGPKSGPATQKGTIIKSKSNITNN